MGELRAKRQSECTVLGDQVRLGEKKAQLLGGRTRESVFELEFIKASVQQIGENSLPEQSFEDLRASGVEAVTGLCPHLCTSAWIPSPARAGVTPGRSRCPGKHGTPSFTGQLWGFLCAALRSQRPSPPVSGILLSEKTDRQTLVSRVSLLCYQPLSHTPPAPGSSSLPFLW